MTQNIITTKELTLNQIVFSVYKKCSYYFSLRLINSKRDFYEKLLPTLKKFIVLITDENLRDFESSFNECKKLYNNQASGLVESESTFTDFLSIVYKIILDIYLDNWEIEKAYEWVKKILDDIDCNTINKVSPLTENSDVNKLKIDLIPILTSLAEELILIENKTDAQYCLNKATEFLAISNSKGLFFENYVNDAKAIYSGSKKKRLVLTHLAQAKNLKKYGLITEKRFIEFEKKLNSQRSDEEKCETLLKEFLSTVGFLILPVDNLKENIDVSDEMVIEPGYFEFDFDKLSSEQKSEYNKAFSKETNLNLVRKYIYVRLQSFLKSVISNKEFSNIDRILIELDLLKKIKFARTSVDFDCNQIIDILNFFNTLSKTELIERLNLLQKLESQKIITPNFSEDGSSFETNDPEFTIRPHNDYYKICTLPINKLQGLIDEKIIESDEELKQEASWENDLEKIEKLEQQYEVFKLYKLLDESKKSPKLIIEALTPYVQGLFNFGEQIVNVRELQIIFWIDKLSIAHVRIKDYKSAINLIEKANKLSSQYWERSNNSEKTSIEKRYKRCLEELQKNNGETAMS